MQQKPSFVAFKISYPLILAFCWFFPQSRVIPVALSGEAGTVGIGLQYGGIWVAQVVIDSGDSVIAPQLCSSAPTQSLPLEIASGVEHPVANCLVLFVSLQLV